MASCLYPFIVKWAKLFHYALAAYWMLYHSSQRIIKLFLIATNKGGVGRFTVAAIKTCFCLVKKDFQCRKRPLRTDAFYNPEF